MHVDAKNLKQPMGRQININQLIYFLIIGRFILLEISMAVLLDLSLLDEDRTTLR